MDVWVAVQCEWFDLAGEIFVRVCDSIPRRTEAVGGQPRRFNAVLMAAVGLFTTDTVASEVEGGDCQFYARLLLF